MTDRVDIDALLIGALYGELTPAEEARLTAHLESHPADRTALAGLTDTRARVRESRILAVQLEPPQSVSALLLQEAARRAPKPDRATAGWFYRFTRSVLMHPAMAAAVMLVLVVGVAGMIYLRRGDPFVETAAPALSAPQTPETGAVEAVSPSAVTSAPEPVVPGRARAEDDSASPNKTAGALAGYGSAANADSYRVGLDEPTPRPAPALQAQDDRPAPAGRAGNATAALIEGNQAKEATRNQAEERPRDLSAKPIVPMPAKVAKKTNAGLGIELRSAEMAPKDLDDDAETAAKTVAKGDAKKQDVAKREVGNVTTGNDRVSKFAADGVAQAPGAAPAGAGGAAAAPSMMPQQNHAAAPPPAADPAPAATTVASKAKAPVKPVSRSSLNQGLAPSPQPAPSPPAIAAEPPSSPRDSRRLADKTTITSTSTPGDAKLAEEKTADDKVLIAWAQKQREQVLAFVKSNNCRAAASAAVAIYNRAPEYYAANIATDRSIKPCIAYVNSERERIDRNRAAMKRANAAEAPAAAPPPATQK
jgi:anti-sigma factor RsiW